MPLGEVECRQPPGCRRQQAPSSRHPGQAAEQKLQQDTPAIEIQLSLVPLALQLLTPQVLAARVPFETQLQLGCLQLTSMRRKSTLW